MVAGSAPAAFAVALRLSAIANLAELAELAAPAIALGAANPRDATDKGTRALVTAFGQEALEQSHPRLAAWHRFVEHEERHARGGLHLTRASLGRAPNARAVPQAGVRQTGVGSTGVGRTGVAQVGVASAEAALAATLDSALRSSHPRTSALERALAASAAIPDRATSEVAAALILCAEGRTDRLRLLPFAMVPESERVAALVEWHGGNDVPWTMLALGALASYARLRRGALQRSVASMPAEDALLDPLRRAAITARRALALLRVELAVTTPALAEALELSRPAAGDALERLAGLGLATEVTGRQRDRVFAYTAALSVATSPRS